MTADPFRLVGSIWHSAFEPTRFYQVMCFWRLTDADSVRLANVERVVETVEEREETRWRCLDIPRKEVTIPLFAMRYLPVRNRTRIARPFETEVQAKAQREAFYRASGDCPCPVCEQTYADHEFDVPGHHFLHVLCNGNRVKL